VALARNQSIERAATLLQAVANEPDGAGATALARATEIPKPTVVRLLATLERCGLLSRDDESPRYRIGHTLIRLARQADPYRALVDKCLPIMQKLVVDTSETSTLAVPTAQGTLETIAQINSPQMIRDLDWVGLDLPLHATSNGKVLLAESPDSVLDGLALPRLARRTLVSHSALRRELADVRAQGYAISIDEAEHGLAGVAVPVRDAAGSLIATLTVSGPTFRFGPAQRTRHLARLRAAATEAEIRLGMKPLQIP
jgi:DNA-binding IclR family transcriptional regulator